ncbi:protein of unknown function DUF1626 [Pyrolobus fumarii 1A]|uniref:DUF3782 domain-containing protein n=1 Tax=Pyrolobus fumarii (strain DSM 11204 / 1A) TaxID=694429 RepID=G0EFK3_PYRF1|nr:DUF3782 domain-containing protein [Pyrolobus fumarii]AEM39027.1 protein of unknown function DUF1626 [Pyrolobus fumarii 1A]
MASGTTSREDLKRAILELLRSDWEFRRAVAAELGLLEILERLVKIEERLLKVEERIEEHTRAIRALQEQVKALQEQMVKLQEQVAEHSRVIRNLQEELRRFGDRLAALGSRWGLYAEDAVRESLYRILQEYLGVARVEKWREYDEAGEVLGRPRIIEIDVVVKNDTHYLIEVKSSIDVYDVYVFNRKCELYTKRVKPPKVKKLMVTFYADDKAVNAAEELGIEIVRG